MLVKKVRKINGMHILSLLLLFMGAVAFFSPDIAKHISYIEEATTSEFSALDDEDFDESSDLAFHYNKVPWSFAGLNITVPNANLVQLQSGVAQMQPVIVHGKSLCIQYQNLKVYCC